MQPGAGHAAARRFARIVAPAAFDAGGMLVAEMTFDVQHLADRAAGDDALELAHGGKAALVVAEPEHDFGLGHRGDGPLGFRARQRQRLLAPHRLARRRHRADLRDVQRMRRRQEHRLHARIGDRIGKFRAQLKTVGFGEIGNELGLFAHAANEAQALALALHRFDDGFAPAPEADDG